MCLRVTRSEILAALGAQETLRVQARVIMQPVLRREAVPAHLAPIALWGGPPQSVDRALVRGQVRSLRVSVAAVLADEGLGVEMARPVILQIVIRHESFLALLAAKTKVALVHSSSVALQRQLVRRDEAARVTGIRNATVQLHVTVHRRRAFERFLADGALVRTHVTVLHHVSL